jgi:hypothetical protein
MVTLLGSAGHNSAATTQPPILTGTSRHLQALRHTYIYLDLTLRTTTICGKAVMPHKRGGNCA